MSEATRDSTGAIRVPESPTERVKLPTGDERRQAGGTTGGALWLEHPFVTSGRWAGYFSLGVSAKIDSRQ